MDANIWQHPFQLFLVIGIYLKRDIIMKHGNCHRNPFTGKVIKIILRIISESNGMYQQIIIKITNFTKASFIKKIG